MRATVNPLTSEFINFYVSWTALLTIIINGMTTEPLYKFLKLSQLDANEAVIHKELFDALEAEMDHEIKYLQVHNLINFFFFFNILILPEENKLAF